MGSRMAPHFSRFSNSWGRTQTSTNRAVLWGVVLRLLLKILPGQRLSAHETTCHRPWGVIHPHSVTHRPWSVEFRIEFRRYFFATRACKLSQTKDCNKRWCISGSFRGQDLFWEFGKKIEMSLLQSVEQQKPYVFGPFHDWTPQCEDWTPKSPPSKARIFFRWIFWPLLGQRCRSVTWYEFHYQNRKKSLALRFFCLNLTPTVMKTSRIMAHLRDMQFSICFHDYLRLKGTEIRGPFSLLFW